jgi:hypothetical protein
LKTVDFVKEVVLLSEGKLPTFTEGSPKWERIVAQGNFYLRELANETGVDWNFFYDPDFSIGTASTSLEYSLDDDIAKLSHQEGDSVLVTNDDQVAPYIIVQPNRLREYRNQHAVAKVGRTLRFSRPINEKLIGGAITAPVYLRPEPFTKANQEIEPQEVVNWLVLATAADRVKNDATRKDLRADLVNQANTAMTALMEINGSQVEEAYRGWNPIGG